MLIYRATFQWENPQKATKMEPEHDQKWFAEAWAKGKGETWGCLTKPEFFMISWNTRGLNPKKSQG